MANGLKLTEAVSNLNLYFIGASDSLFMGKRFNDKVWLEQLAEDERSLEFVRDWQELLKQLIAASKGGWERACQEHRQLPTLSVNGFRVARNWSQKIAAVKRISVFQLRAKHRRRYTFLAHC